MRTSRPSCCALRRSFWREFQARMLLQILRMMSEKVVVGSLPPNGESLGDNWSRRMNHSRSPSRRGSSFLPLFVLFHVFTVSSNSFSGNLLIVTMQCGSALGSQVGKMGSGCHASL